MLVEAFMYRHHPSWVAALGLVRDGSVGELQAVQSWFSYFNDDPENIRNRVESGGGAVMDIGCYNISLSRMLFDGEPTSVESAVQRDPVMGIDTLTSGVLEFAGGGQASFACSTRAENYQRVHIIGTEGRIEIEIPFNIPPDRETRIFLTRGGEPPTAPNTETLLFPASNQYTIQAELFAQAIIDGAEYPLPISDAVGNMRVIEAVLSG
jgi:predicted dehydrogenase